MCCRELNDRGTAPLKRLGALLVLSMLGVATAQAAEITVSWTDVQRMVRPRQDQYSVHRTVRLTLQGGSQISEVMSSTNSRGRSRQATREGNLRDTMEPGRRRMDVAWRVGDSRTLVRTASYPQHTVTIRVRTLSDTSCRAEISIHLRSGYREYMMWGMRSREPQYYSSIRAQDITCSVGG